MAILEDRGIFWWNDVIVPKSQFAPKVSVGGKVTIEETGAVRLELDAMMPGTKHPFEVLHDSGKPTGRNIQGLLNGNGEHVLLLNVIRNGGTMRTANVSQEHYLALQCLVGGSAFKQDTNKQISFRSLIVNLAGFENWLWLRGITVKRTAKKLSVKYEKPADRTYKMPFGMLKIEYDISGPGFSGNERRVTLTQNARVNITPATYMGMEDCQRYYQHLEELLILLTSSDRNLDWPTVIVTEKKQHAKLYFMRYRSDAKEPGAHECLISFPKIVGSFGDFFTALIEKRERYGPGFYLYLGTRRGFKMFVEHRFVNLIWGLEAFDRHGRGQVEADSALSAKIARILSQVSANKDRAWLEGRLRHAAEPSLSERLFTLFSALPIPFDLKGLRKFCDDCQDRRNDISHFGGTRKMGQKYNEFMRDLDQKSGVLAALYHLHLLTVIGVPKERLDFSANANWPLSRMERELRSAGLLPNKSGPDAGAD